MKTKFTLMTAIATVVFVGAAFTASAQRGYGFAPHRFYAAPVRIMAPAVSVRFGVPLPIAPQVACAPGYGYAEGYGYAPAPVVVAGGFYRDRVVIERRARFGHYRRF